MTGFGKTGTCFASEQLTIQPDILCMSKALTAGLLPMGATSCTREVFDAFYSDDLAKGFFHGHTYTANPLSCAAALAALDLFHSEGIQDGIKQIGEWHQSFESEISDHAAVAATRRIGVILALDLALPVERYGQMRDRFYRFFLDQGVFLRPLGKTIYFLPPYVIRREELQQVYQATRKLLDVL